MEHVSQLAVEKELFKEPMGEEELLHDSTRFGVVLM